MACPDVEHLLDAFVDTELPPPQLLEVARHAAGCPSCDGAIRDLTSLRQSIATLLDRQAAQLDLAPVWPAVAASLPHAVARPTRVVSLTSRLRAAPIVGGLMALAASVLLWIGPPATTRLAGHSPGGAPPAGKQLASVAMRPSNHADIDRLAGKDIAVRREPKSGTTIIWVNHVVEGDR